MAVYYTQYSVITDFGGVDPDTTKLHAEIIAANPLPTATYLGIQTGFDSNLDPDADSVLIITSIAPTGGEKTALDVVIAAHPDTGVPPQPPGEGGFAFSRDLEFDVWHNEPVLISLDDTVIGVEWKDNQTYEAIGNVPLTNAPIPDGGDVNPIINFEVYTAFSGGSPGAGNVRVKAEVRYIAPGELTSKAADETLFKVVAMSATNKERAIGKITLDRSLVMSSDMISIVLTRDWADAADTYGDRVMLAKRATLQFE